MKNFACPINVTRARTTLPSKARPRYLIAILLAFISVTTPALAFAPDSLMGTLQGIVSAIGPDGQQFSTPGAKVRLIGSSREATSLSLVAADSGEYRFSGVPPRSYTLEVAVDGFDNVARPITIHAGETTVENVKLEVKSVREEVPVTAARQGLK